MLQVHIVFTSITFNYVFSMATILCLFSESEMKGDAPVVPNPMVNHHRDYSHIIPKGDDVNLNPCKSCQMQGLCDSDECGMKAFPLDSPFPSTRFPNLGAYVDFVKHYGWL